MLQVGIPKAAQLIGQDLVKCPRRKGGYPEEIGLINPISSILKETEQQPLILQEDTTDNAKEEPTSNENLTEAAAKGASRRKAKAPVKHKPNIDSQKNEASPKVESASPTLKDETAELPAEPQCLVCGQYLNIR